jgi:hypothetical protein
MSIVQLLTLLVEIVEVAVVVLASPLFADPAEMAPLKLP